MCTKTRALGLRGWSVPPRYFGMCALVMGLHKPGGWAGAARGPQHLQHVCDRPPALLQETSKWPQPRFPLHWGQPQPGPVLPFCLSLLGSWHSPGSPRCSLPSFWHCILQGSLLLPSLTKSWKSVLFLQASSRILQAPTCCSFQSDNTEGLIQLFPTKSR